MEEKTEFNQKTTGNERLLQQFRIEVVDGDKGRFFSIRPLGQQRYEIFDEDGSIGTVLLDEKDHAHCESQGCELDLPLLHSIRDQIRFHNKMHGDSI
ncbi:hypothetical protein [Pedobacter namyangjuensis]|uniref:hypothetical protein n=1 Tax=Pedobacter namyangjuensis TaxID=600626 RepID=UPI001F065D80|nr:hypothetical protein [Pedobacter namyangjuensis]